MDRTLICTGTYESTCHILNAPTCFELIKINPSQLRYHNMTGHVAVALACVSRRLVDTYGEKCV